MDADRAGGNPPTPANGDSSMFDGSSGLIPQTPWDQVPECTSPMEPHDCGPSMSNVRSALSRADAATAEQFTEVTA